MTEQQPIENLQESGSKVELSSQATSASNASIPFGDIPAMRFWLWQLESDGGN